MIRPAHQRDAAQAPGPLSPGGVASTAEADSPTAFVDDLHVTFTRRGQAIPAVRGVSLDVRRGEVLGLVGESGSGKTVLGLTLMGLLPSDPRPTVSGRAVVGDMDMVSARDDERRRVRREHLGVVFQDPMSSLNPTMRIGRQLREAADKGRDTLELLDLVGLTQLRDRLGAFPFELSGGQAQRVMMSMAIARTPSLIIADEPTTALDVTVQAQILRLVLSLKRELNCAFLFITHNLPVAAEIADRVAVMYAGKIVEVGTSVQVFTRPLHPYSTLLAKSRLTLSTDKSHQLPTIAGTVPGVQDLPAGCPFAPRCPLRIEKCDVQMPALTSLPGDRVAACFCLDRVEAWSRDLDQRVATQSWGGRASGDMKDVVVHVDGVSKVFPAKRRGDRADVHAVRDFSLKVRQGESVALVGESGSGKTTVLRIIAGLEEATEGSIAVAKGGESQVIFQDATSSLTPWMSVRRHLEQRLVAKGTPRNEVQARIADTLSLVGLPEDVLDAKPRQLSGGQAQRVALARAIAVPPAVLLADEPSSALDVSLAATVLNLLGALRRRLGLTMVFVTHDLAAARVVADRIVVMRQGMIVEQGNADDVIADPQEDYTRALVAAVPGEKVGKITTGSESLIGVDSSLIQS